MKCLLAFLLNFLCCLVEVHSQTEYPYVSFMGVDLPNHAYVNLTLVGNVITGTGNTVRCHTDLESCCTSSQGVHRGDWYFPNSSVLAGGGGGGDIYRSRGPQVVHLRRRNNATSPSGIYRCDIETIVMNGADVNTITGETVYVGLYPPSGGIHIYQFPKLSSSTDMSLIGDITTIPGGVSLSMNILTWISIGGPATTVTWTKDSVTITEGTETVLNSQVTAQYTHTLTVTSGGEYTCTVANGKPSTASSTITVQGIYNQKADQIKYHIKFIASLLLFKNNEYCMFNNKLI